MKGAETRASRGRSARVALALLPLLSCAVAGRAPTVLKEPVTGMELVLVKGGCFPMGDTFGDGDVEETPVHEVCLGDFLIGRFEVTRGQWRSVMGTEPSRDACRGDDCPVDGVSWSEAQEFIARLNATSGAGRYRLPTEAEWEYAARSGGRREKFSGGGDPGRFAWYSENSGRRNHPVGTKAPNGLGIHDMSGNVWEWTQDWFGVRYYAESPRDDPRGPAASTGQDVDHVIRGGCKTGEAASARTTRRSYGFQRTSSDRGDKIGFRVVATVPAR